MSLQVNLSSKALSDAYHDVLNNRGINWALFTYEKGSNDLKVPSRGNGGLDELQEQFSDGRWALIYLQIVQVMDGIRYGFSRVLDPNVWEHTTFTLSTTSYFLLFRFLRFPRRPTLILLSSCLMWKQRLDPSILPKRRHHVDLSR
jgi:hypothetical protein